MGNLGYLDEVGISPDSNVDGLRKNTGGVFENFGVRPHQARKARRTNYVRPS